VLLKVVLVAELFVAQFAEVLDHQRRCGCAAGCVIVGGIRRIGVSVEELLLLFVVAGQFGGLVVKNIGDCEWLVGIGRVG